MCVCVCTSARARVGERYTMPPVKKLPADALKLLRTIAVSRARVRLVRVRCRQCRTRLACNLAVVREHLKECGSGSLENGDDAAKENELVLVVS